MVQKVLQKGIRIFGSGFPFCISIVNKFVTETLDTDKQNDVKFRKLAEH